VNSFINAYCYLFLSQFSPKNCSRPVNREKSIADDEQDDECREGRAKYRGREIIQIPSGTAV